MSRDASCVEPLCSKTISRMISRHLHQRTAFSRHLHWRHPSRWKHQDWWTAMFRVTNTLKTFFQMAITSQHAWEEKWTKLGHKGPAKKRLEILSWRRASATACIQPNVTFYCRVVNINIKNKQHSEGKFGKSTDACSKTPTSDTAWDDSRMKCLSCGV